jgi:hypothetical protein
MSSFVSNSNKKTYREPKLTVYGSLTHMTGAASSTKSNKDGGNNSTKTA